MNVLTEWLTNQIPVIFVMGVVIWWLQNRLKKSEERSRHLADSIIEQSTLWQHLAESIGEERKEKADAIHNGIKEAIRKIEELRSLIIK